MSSLYLGTIGNGTDVYQIHAFTKDLPFRGFAAAQISDRILFQRLLESRYEVLEGGRAIYCTAVHPDKDRRMEYNPHDDRPGTVHIVSINNKTNEIACGISVAVDCNGKEHGEIIGLPLENRWKRNGYREGSSLDQFRYSYLRSNRDTGRTIAPWEMAELYRHFRKEANGGGLICRLGVYTGAYHLLVREARKYRLRPTTLWVFDAIPQYFQLYRFAGAAVLRNPSIETPSRLISPGKDNVYEETTGGQRTIHYQGECISRPLSVPIPSNCNGELEFNMEDVPFLDGLVDIELVERAVRQSPTELQPLMFNGMEDQDISMLRMGLSVIAHRFFEDSYSATSQVNNYYKSLRQNIVSQCEFNRIGRYN